MDRLTALIALSHLKLRAEILQRHPEYLDGLDMNPKFAGLASAVSKLQFKLEARSDRALARIASADERTNAAFNKIDESLDATDRATADIEAFAASLEGGNGGPLLDSSVPADVPSDPELLSVNGVAQG